MNKTKKKFLKIKSKKKFTNKKIRGGSGNAGNANNTSWSSITRKKRPPKLDLSFTKEEESLNLHIIQASQKLKTLNIFQIFDIFNRLEKNYDYQLKDLEEIQFINGITYDIATVIYINTNQEFFFYRSSGTSRGDLQINGIWFPIDIISIDQLHKLNSDTNTTLRIPKPDDIFLSNDLKLRNQITEELKISQLLNLNNTKTEILKYGRFINKNNALISLYLLKLSYAMEFVSSNMIDVSRCFKEIDEHLYSYLKGCFTRYIQIFSSNDSVKQIGMAENSINIKPEEYTHSDKDNTSTVVQKLLYVCYIYEPDNLKIFQ